MEVPSAPRALRPRKPWLAGLLSLWLPGLGQLYAGSWKRALLLAFGYPLLLWVLALAGLLKTFAGFVAWLSVIPLYYGWVIWDAVRLARSRRDHRLKPFNRWYLYLGLGLLANLSFGLPDRPLLPIRTLRIPGQHMEPAILAGDHLVADAHYWRYHTPSRGDLVIFTSPERPDAMVLHRVIALPGEQVEIRDKVVFIDGRKLTDDWGVYNDPEIYTGIFPSTGGRRDNFGPLRVPAETTFTVGDNRDNSYDSRFYGPVPNRLLQAKPLFVYWAADKSRIGTRLQ